MLYLENSAFSALEEIKLNSYKVIKSRKAKGSKPIEFLRGEYVVCVEESDENSEWANWTLCKSANCEGWVPSGIIDRDKKIGVTLEGYNSREFSIEVEEVYFSNKVLNGWLWGHRKDKPFDFAWIPLNHVEIIEEDVC